MSRKRADLIFTVALLAVLAWMIWEAGGWNFRARLFPLTVGIPAIALALVQLGWLLKISASSHAAVVTPQAIEGALPPEAAARPVPPEVARARSLGMVACVLASAIAVVLLGFELGGGLLTFVFLRFASRERLSTSLLIAVFTYLAFYALFDRALSIPLPSGAVAEGLGLDKSLDHYLVDPLASLIHPR